MPGAPVCTSWLSVSKPRFLNVCNPISTDSTVLTTRRHTPACYIAVTPNASRRIREFSCGTLRFLNISKRKTLLVTFLAFASTCFVLFPNLGWMYISFKFAGNSNLFEFLFLLSEDKYFCSWSHHHCSAMSLCVLCDARPFAVVSRYCSSHLCFSFCSFSAWESCSRKITKFLSLRAIFFFRSWAGHGFALRFFHNICSFFNF